MAIDNTVNLSQVANQYQKNDILTKPQKYQVNPNAVDKTPDKDTVQLSSGLTTKEKVGIGAAITTGVALITLAVLGRNGHLGDGVQKFLGGKAKKAAQDAINGWDPTGGCIYYFNPNTATNKWIWSRPHVKTIGKHRFCK